MEKKEKIDPKEYPKYLFHKDEGKKLIHSPEEEKELGSGWKDTPAAFESKEKGPAHPVKGKA